MKLYLLRDDIRALMESFPYKGNELLNLALQFPSSPKLRDPETIHYFLLYESLFARFRHGAIRLLEIGAYKGDSLRLWQEYFPRGAVYGIDIELQPEAENLSVFVGDQKDPNFLAEVVRQAGPFDIIIDDGSHRMGDQIASLTYLFPNGLRSGGIYVLEDLGTSYWDDWGGGVGQDNTTISFLKGLVDSINYRAFKGGRRGYRGPTARIPRHEELVIDEFDELLVSISFARSFCSLSKGDNRSIDAFGKINA